MLCALRNFFAKKNAEVELIGFIDSEGRRAYVRGSLYGDISLVNISNIKISNGKLFIEEEILA